MSKYRNKLLCKFDDFPMVSFENMNDIIKENPSIYCSLDANETLEVKIKDYSHIINNLHIKDNCLYGDVEFIDTEQGNLGQDIYGKCESNVSFAINGIITDGKLSSIYNFHLKYNNN